MKGNSSLEHLDLSYSDFGLVDGRDEAILNQMRLMMNNNYNKFTLLSLNLSGCNLGDLGCEFLFNSIQ